MFSQVMNETNSSGTCAKKNLTSISHQVHGKISEQVFFKFLISLLASDMQYFQVKI